MIERLSHREDMGSPLGNLYGLIYRMDRTADARDRRGAEGRMLRAVSRSHHDLGYGRARHCGLSRSRERPATRASMGTHPSRPTPSGLESMLSLVRELPVGLDKAALSPADVTRRLRSRE